MNMIELLILNGAPGSGKSTVANALSEKLRELDQSHAVIDLDDLAMIYPEDGGDLKWNNLASVWPNYTKIINGKVIIPVLIDSADDLKKINEATQQCKITICELVASTQVLKDRVTKREPNEYWQNKLRGLVENYNKRDASERFSDFVIFTGESTVEDTVSQIISIMHWDAA